MSCMPLAECALFVGANSDEQGVRGVYFGGIEIDSNIEHRHPMQSQRNPAVTVLELLHVYMLCRWTNQGHVTGVSFWHVKGKLQSVFLHFTVFISFAFELGTIGSTSQCVCVNLVRYLNARLDHPSVPPRSQNRQSKPSSTQRPALLSKAQDSPANTKSPRHAVGS